MNTVKFARLISFLSRVFQVEITESKIETIHKAVNDLVEYQTENLRKQLNTATNYANPQLIADMLKAIACNQKIEAIKCHRALTGYGLKESKDEIERYWPSRLSDILPSNKG